MGATSGAGTVYPTGAPPVFCEVRVTRSLALCVVDCCFSFCTFSVGANVLCDLLRYTDSNYPFGIFKLF